MSNLKELKQATLDKVEEAFVKAEEALKTKIKRVPVVFNNRLTSTAGKAYYDSYTHSGIKIELSTQLLEVNGQEFIDHTPGHEAAHIIALEIYRREGRDHGYAWKHIMRIIGQEPVRCHNFKRAETITRMKHRVMCGCNEPREMGKIQFRRLLQGTAYRCGICKQSIKIPSTTNKPQERPKLEICQSTTKTRKRRNTRVRVGCGCSGGTLITKNRYGRMLRGLVYAHSTCGQKLVLP